MEIKASKPFTFTSMQGAGGGSITVSGNPIIHPYTDHCNWDPTLNQMNQNGIEAGKLINPRVLA